MEPISSAIDILDFCIRSGKFVILKYKDYKNAAQDISEMIVIIEASWIQTEIQLESVRKFWRVLDSRLQSLFHELLDLLLSKLQAAERKVKATISSDDSHVATEKTTVVLATRKLSVNKITAVFLKNSIQKLVNDLEAWQKRFDPSWYLITRIANPMIDTCLEIEETGRDAPTEKLKRIREAIRPSGSSTQKGSIFLDSETLEHGNIPVSWSTASIARIREDETAVLLDTLAYRSDLDSATLVTHVRNLARLLSNVDPKTFGLLRCHGVIRSTDDNGKIIGIQLAFDIPPTLSKPRSLRECLIRRESWPLNQRFQLARQLARSVMFVHTSNFVHKNIRPESVIVLQDHGLGLASFLIGFEQFRSADAGTFRRGDLPWEKNLYRHPRRQGLHPEDEYVMQHDIYSLGVCLLEIGLWSSFVSPDGDSMGPGTELIDIADAIDAKHAQAIKRKLVLLATDRLPSLMGQRYTNLVISCLNCLDTGETNIFGKMGDLEDEDGIIVGVQYIEKILLQVEDITV